ncbi:serine protease grass-like [Armigeres subalbatus]|uniref:serine protease grass-like n=1 Tax=Armigeres subalbatus TaxID=124917 RepID=UPI002ED027A8
MRFIIFVSLFIHQTVAQRDFKPCSYNEFCVDLRECPAYKQYANTGFRYWPADVKRMAKEKLCNQEMVDGQMVISVCCPSVMNNPKCGVQAGDRISKGQVAKPYEYPWMALLRDLNGKFVCGGTLISERYVLTAAHCVRFDRIRSVRLGENDINQEVDCIILDGERDCAPPPQDIKIEKTIIHPEHSERRKINDIALLRLEHGAKFVDNVRTICLPNRDIKQRAVVPSFLIVSGWGLTDKQESFDVLRYARVPPVPLQECAPKVQNLIAAVRLGDSHICAGGVDEVDNCAGDSGGPLQYISNTTSKYIQYGIVSFGTKTCGNVSEPGVYTKVEHFISWILNEVGE